MNHTPYAKLTPDLVLDAIESLGYLSDLRVLALNSYENRVYQVGIEDSEPLIAKFYRPQRWSDAQILEEHEFSLALAELEVPVIPPLTLDNGESLHSYQDYRFSLYPRRGGHAPELGNLDTLYTIGQHLGRIHALGRTSQFKERPNINIETYCIKSREYILENDFLASSLRPAYEAISLQLTEKITDVMNNFEYSEIRLHGDCHPGNIIQRSDSMYLVDLDDARSGPAVQDLWMLLSGEYHHRVRQMESILEGYEEFCEFNMRELNLIEALRGMRLLYYAAWLAQRWGDPAFPMAFPWFNTERYWSQHILELKEQYSELDTPALKLLP